MGEDERDREKIKREREAAFGLFMRNVFTVSCLRTCVFLSQRVRERERERAEVGWLLL
jgi:hypothetical protein